MSSNRSSSEAHAAAVDAASSVGWSSGIRLGLYFLVLFTLVSAGLFGLVYVGVARTIHERELELIRNTAAEYRAWFLNGDRAMLGARMEEQSMQSGDIMFVHISGPGFDYVKFNAPPGSPLPSEDLRMPDPSVDGVEVEMGGDRWLVASLPIGDRGLVLQAGKNVRAREAVLASTRKLFAITLIPAMLAAMLGGAWLTYRAMGPIRRLIVVMRETLRAGDSGRRVEPEPGRNELNALVELFNRMLARNEALIGAMRDSLDNVAHDMRTPLSRLTNTAERALQEGDDPGQLREALADCVEESEHLGRLLTALMDVAEAEAGVMRLDMETFSLPDLVESVVELYEFVAEDKEISVLSDLPDECMIRADQTRIGQVLANLFDNAIKYSPRGSSVKVAVRPDADFVTVAVSDEGCGISEADLPHIWDRLFRSEPSRTAPGMGLGLSFVKAIVTAHGGRVGVESALNKGSTFRIEIPTGQ